MFCREKMDISDGGFGFVPCVSFLFPVPWLVGIRATIPSFVGVIWELLDAPAPGLLDILRGSGQEKSLS